MKSNFRFAVIFTLLGSCLTFKLDQEHSLSPYSGHISPEIVKELSDFIELIPKLELDGLIAEYMITDGKFRRAANFLESKDFNKLLNATTEVPEVVNLLDYLHIWESELKAVDERYQYNQILRQRQHQLQGRLTRSSTFEYENEYDLSAINLGSFTSFVNAVVDILPRDQYADLIKSKCQKTSTFAEFYRNLRSEQFKPKVDAVLASKNLSPILNTLHSHLIEVNELAPIFFTVISWGPVV